MPGEDDDNIQRGGGKFAAMQQRAAAAGLQQDSDSSSSSSSDSDDDLPVHRPTGGGKSFGKMLNRAGAGGGKNISALQKPGDDSEDDSDDDDDNVGAPPQYGGKSLAAMRQVAAGGKQLPPKVKPAPADDDMEESSEDDDNDNNENIGDDEIDPDDYEDEIIEELDMETFDTAKLIRSEADRKKLEAMPEFEREAELAERFDRLKNELDMKRALQQDKRRKREQAEATKAAQAKGKKGAKTTAKGGRATRASARTRKKQEEAADADLAASLSTTQRKSSKRNKDATGAKGKKATARANLLADRRAAQKSSADPDESDSDLDYGDEASDSESDYEDGEAKPWLQNKTAAAGTRKTRLQREATASSDSDSDEDDNDADGTGRRPRPSGATTEFVPADVADYAKVTIPRRRLSRWCHEPFFEQAVTGMYVKLAVGKDSQKSMKSCYRLCQIVGVETRPAEYAFPPEKGSNRTPVRIIHDIIYSICIVGLIWTSHRDVFLHLPSSFTLIILQISTNKVLKLQFGSSVRAFRMALVSDSKPQEDDVRALVSHLRDSRLNDDILSKKRAIKLRKVQDKLVNTYTYTREDIEKSVAAKKKRKVGNIGAETTRAAIAVQAAQEDVKDAEARLDEARRAHLEAGEDDTGVDQLESAVTLATEALEDAKSRLEEKKLEQERILTAEQIRKKRIKGAEKIQEWNRVNERAMEKNKMADYEAYKQQREQEKREAAAQGQGGAPKFNPYARRKVKPKILWEVGQKADEDDNNNKDKAQAEDAAAAGTAAGGGGAAGGGAAAQASSDGPKEANANANVPGKENAAEIVNDDFAIDDELLVRGGTDSLLAAATGRAGGVRARKGLSFAEYQKAKEVGHL